MPPFFTIITATYNAAATLPRLLASLASQTCRDFCWVVQDGCSKDDTLAIIEAWRDGLPSVSIESAPDTGIYDAWNRALERMAQFPQEVRGEWVLFLGADDLLADAFVLARVKEFVEGYTPSPIFVLGNLHVFSEDKNVSEFVDYEVEEAFGRRYQGMPVPQPSLFMHISCFDRLKFDTSYRIAGDYDFLLRAWVSPAQMHKIPLTVAHFSTQGISSNALQSRLLRKETWRVRRKYFPLRGDTFIQYVRQWSSFIKCEVVAEVKSACIKNTTGARFWRWLKLCKLRYAPPAELNAFHVPIFVISYNRLAPLRKLVLWLETHGYTNIIIVDNASTYPPLVEYLEQSTFRVVRLKKNYGHQVVWLCGRFDSILEQQFYVVTDCDVLPDEDCPQDIVAHFYEILKNYSFLTKVGFSLRIDDLPDCFAQKNDVILWESRFWEKKLRNASAFKAPIDTTFALYRPGIFPEDNKWWIAGRTDFPYVAQHLPWYEDSLNPSEETRYYQASIKTGSSHWLSSEEELRNENAKLRQELQILKNDMALMAMTWHASLIFLSRSVWWRLKNIFETWYYTKK